MAENFGFGKFKGKKQRARPNPYSRSTANGPVDNDSDDLTTGNKSIIGKVTNYIVPSWISGWLSKDNSKVTHQDTKEEESYTTSQFKNNIDTSTKSKYSYSESIERASATTYERDMLQQDNNVDPSESANASENTRTSLQSQPRKELSTFIKATNPVQKFTKLSSYKRPLEKPAFRVSAFVSPDEQSYSFNTTLQSATLDFTGGKSSPFYSGNTTYGGSTSLRGTSAKRQKLSPVSTRVRTTRTQVSAKPLRHTKKSTVTSETAKKILSTLNKMSAPVKDSRPVTIGQLSNIPSFSQKLRDTQKKTRNDTVNQPPVALNSSLLFPAKKASILQNTPSLTLESKNVSVVTQQFKKTVPTSSSSSNLKMKREKSSLHYSNQSQEENEIVNDIPEVTVAVPFSVNSLPKFSFGSVKSGVPTFTPIPKTSSSSLPSSTPFCSGQTPFVTPVVKMSTESLKFGPNPVLSFTPQHKSESHNASFHFTSPGVLGNKSVLSTLNKNFAFSSPVNVQIKNKEKCEIPKNKFPSWNSKILQNPPDNWECPTCMISNKKDVMSCVACCEKKPNSESRTVSVGQSTMKPSGAPLRKLNIKQPPADNWECPTCMISNKNDAIKCVACNENKPVAKEISKPSEAAKSTSVFPIRKLNIQQPPTGSWECPTCMINNNKDVSQCAACGEKKPNNEPVSNASSIKSSQPFRKLNIKQPAADNWECPTCMISNKKDILSCVACNEKKPGLNGQAVSSGFSTTSSNFSFSSLPKTSEPSSGFSFGVSNDTKSAASSNAGFSFGNKTNSDTGFSFGTKTVPSTASDTGFSFGTKTVISTAPDSGFSFGTKTVTSTAPDTGFSFGVKPVSSTAPDTGFSFGTKPVTSTAPDSGFSFGTQTAASTTSDTGFSFGTKPVTSTAPDTGFSFGTKPVSSAASDTGFSYSFGTKTETSIAPDPGFPFGTKSISSATSDTGFSFGTKTVSSTASNEGFSFGVKKDVTASTSILPSTATIDKPAKATGFNISSNNARSDQSSVFGSSVAPIQNTTGFSFGNSSKPTATAAAAGFTFGTTAAFSNTTGENPFKNSELTSKPVNEPASNVPFCFGGATNTSQQFGFSAAPSFLSKPDSNTNVPAAGGSTNIFGSGVTPSFLTNNDNKPANTGFNFSSAVKTDFNFNGPSVNTGSLFSMGSANSSNNAVPTGDQTKNHTTQRRQIKRAARRLKKAT